MAYRQGGEAYLVMWIGKRQWEGLPGKFDVGQTSWVCPTDEPMELFRFFPAFGSRSAWWYQVMCEAEDFLRSPCSRMREAAPKDACWTVRLLPGYRAASAQAVGHQGAS
jgi:hypothetical protein